MTFVFERTEILTLLSALDDHESMYRNSTEHPDPEYIEQINKIKTYLDSKLPE